MSVEHRWNDTDRNLSQCQFLGAFAKLRKTIISLVMSVRLSVRLSVRPAVRMEQLGSHSTNFHEI